MPDFNIPQLEADALIEIDKVKESQQSYDFPSIGENLVVPLISQDGKEKFILDVSRGKIEVKKAKYQNRGRKVVILLRLDIMGGKHTNPDGSEVECPHIHIYREDYADKWAFPLPPEFSNTADLLLTLDQFMEYCHVVDKPMIQGSSI